MFIGRTHWIDKGKSSGRIQVYQEKRIEALGEVSFDTCMKGTVTCDSDLHTQYRSVLGHIKWLHSRTQFQSCYLFSRCASA
eukprot:4004360-Prorocentrum_lima.AAC.1